MFSGFELICHVNEGGRGSMSTVFLVLVVKVLVLMVKAGSPYLKFRQQYYLRDFINCIFCLLLLFLLQRKLQVLSHGKAVEDRIS